MKYILALTLAFFCWLAFFAVEQVSLDLMSKSTAGMIMLILGAAAFVISRDFLRD